MSADSKRRPGFPAQLPDPAGGLVSLRTDGGSASSRSRGAGPDTPLQSARPAGLGLDSVTVRLKMVDRLRSQGITDPEVLKAMKEVPRHLFVDRALVHQAYEDTSLPIGHGQTISKPLVVARMLSILREGCSGGRIDGTVLEIGTGCGYQAALLSCLFRRVVSIERIQALHERARSHLDEAGVRGVRLVFGDGRAGHGPWAPYTAIVAAAGAGELPNTWIEQLAPDGRLVAPVHSDTHAGQVLLSVRRGQDGALIRQHRDLVHFVPLEFGVHSGS